MDKESDIGNIEYKRYIKFSTEKRRTSLASQLKFRLKEGNGFCIYNIGVEDNGELFNITENCYNESIENLKQMCNSVEAEIISIEKIYPCEKKYIDKYYYKILINDIITNSQFRILNISNIFKKSDIQIIGFDQNNNILIEEFETVYDIKKNSKNLFYIYNFIFNSTNFIKYVLTYKPHLISFNCDPIEIERYLPLLEEMNIKYIFSSSFSCKECTESMSKLLDYIPEIKINNFKSNNSFNIFQVLYSGNILNNTKIYACISNNMIYNKDELYMHTSEKSSKLIINEIHNLFQPMQIINRDKVISISTNEKIISKINTPTVINEYHICENYLCKCNVKYTDKISYLVTSQINLNTEYIAYYKNNLLKVKFENDCIIMNRHVYIDEKFLIIDVISQFIVVNLLQ